MSAMRMRLFSRTLLIYERSRPESSATYTRQKKFGRTWEGRTWGNGSGDGTGQAFARIQRDVSQYCNARFVIWFHGGRR